jgi:hypothetical protein
MPDGADFSSGPSMSFESPCSFSSECWSPACFSPVSSSFSDVSSVSRVSSTLDFNTTSLYGSSISAGLDSHKSSADLVREGTFVQSNLTPRYDQGDRQAAEQPKIIVSNEATITPDYIVRQDGKVEVVGNPESGDKAHSVYRVQVEPGADQKTTDALVSYLNDRIHQKEPGAQVSLLAGDGLVSEDLARKFNVSPDKPDTPPQDQDNPPPEDDNTPDDPDGGGNCPNNDNTPDDSPDTPPDNNPDNNPDANPDQTPDTPPQPDVPQTPAGPFDNLLEAASLNSWDNNTNGSLGAYEIDAGNWFSSWLDDDMIEELGHPPDYKKLGKVLAKHKNDPKFKANMAARLGNMREQGDNKGADKIEGVFNRLSDEKESTFAENFGIFLNSQKPGGRNATGEEMNQFFDKDMQKAIASSRIADVAHDAHVKVKDLPPDQAAKIALAGALGHIPSDKEQADYNKYLQSIQSRFKPNKS